MVTEQQENQFQRPNKIFKSPIFIYVEDKRYVLNTVS